MDGFEFSADPARIDTDRVHAWLSEQAYWAEGRTRERHERAMAASRNYGIYRQDGVQVAYARVITDDATFAWLCDVFVDPSVRGQQVGKTLIAEIVNELEPLGLKRMALTTADAHGLYAQFGFTALPDPDQMMVRMTRTSAQS